MFFFEIKSSCVHFRQKIEIFFFIFHTNGMFSNEFPLLLNSNETKKVRK